MSAPAAQTAPWAGWFTLLLAVFVYFYALDSKNAATNPDECLYMQITRLTAEQGHWLPLQAAETKSRNTKPPALFWQGIISTNWGKNWELWRLRWPNALYSIATAALVFLIARKITGSLSNGVVGALIYLAFFGVYRHGRVFLTSAPETFWLFLPFFILLIAPGHCRQTWRSSATFGVIIGIGLLWKSFAMVIPTVGTLAVWTWKARGSETKKWLRDDAPRLLLTAVIALAVFALWFVFDPQRSFILNDFILKENIGKFETPGGSYWSNALTGKHSIWALALGWFSNAGLMAPAVLTVFLLSWQNRRHVSRAEKLLWLWIITLFVFHLLPNLRYERYLLPAMPAIAVLCGIYWERIPRWVLCLILAACITMTLALLAAAALLASYLSDTATYSLAEWICLSTVPAFCAAGLILKRMTRSFALPAVFLVYLELTLFVRPFDRPTGQFPVSAIQTACGATVILPAHFMAREEFYRLLLPGANVRRIKEKNLQSALADTKNRLLIIPSNLGYAQDLPGFAKIGRRLSLPENLDAMTGSEILQGKIAQSLFVWDVLIERR